MAITLKQAKNLTYGDELYHVNLKNADGSPMRFRVSGKVKTWKRDETRIRVPLKHGLYDYGYLVNDTIEGGRFSFLLQLNEVKLP
jgi:hypothetical protein